MGLINFPWRQEGNHNGKYSNIIIHSHFWMSSGSLGTAFSAVNGDNFSDLIMPVWLSHLLAVWLSRLLAYWQTCWLKRWPICYLFDCPLVELPSWLIAFVFAIIQAHIFYLFTMWVGQWGSCLPHFRFPASLAERPQRPLHWVTCLSTAWQTSHFPGWLNGWIKGSMGGWMKIRTKFFTLPWSQYAVQMLY